MSRGFTSMLIGVAITIFAWFSPWNWPAWPGFAVLSLFSRVQTTFAERSAVVVLCIVVNVVAWAAVCWLFQWLIARWRTPLPD